MRTRSTSPTSGLRATSSLPRRAGAQPVRIAVWDSGVDTALFGKQVLRDGGGQPLLIAFDKYSRPALGELCRLRPRCAAGCRR